jgi:Zn-dependent protease with chaperone function
MADYHSTNFFYRQNQARKNCRNLVVLFVIAVILIIAAIYFSFRLIYFIYLFTSVYDSSPVTSNAYSQKLGNFSFWDPSLFFLIAGIVTIFVFIASSIKMNQLQKGGGAIAEMLGGRFIPRDSNEPSERKFLNIVEEISIASGVSVPLAYVLEKENGINAFAAGLTLHNSALAVTRGMLDYLTRDELQGVIAHEFSHILNGDARLNTQLIGTLYGILAIGVIGGEIIDHHRITRTSVVLLSAGIILAIVGYAGSFMGRLIQCAVSRQQELLADASAVQFTRNPGGLANALKKIGGYIHSSLVQSSTARQACHLFFSESNIDFLFPNLLATHPPLLQRIRLLDPVFDGVFPKIQVKPAISKVASKYITEYNQYKNAVSLSSGSLFEEKPANIINLVGNPTGAHLDQSKTILALIPDEVKQYLNVSQSAVCLIYALFVGCECTDREAQIAVLRKALVLEKEIAEVIRICDLLSKLGQAVRLPLVELSVPSLLTLTSSGKRNFLKIINLLVNADAKVTLFEFTVQWILNKLLIETENISDKISFFSYSQVASDIFILLKTLSCSDHIDNAQKAFDAGVARIPEITDRKPDFHYNENISFADVWHSLDQLSRSSFKIKQSVIDACAHCAFADNTVTVAESNLLRVISLALSCPLPLLLPENK